jgi:hypothetical protein
MQPHLPLFGEPAVVTPKAKRRLSPSHNAPVHDLAVTPDPLARAVVDYFAPRGRLFDPARGSGPFYRAMLRHSHDVRWCEIAAGRDFLVSTERADWIITNPPWSKLRPFLLQAMRLAPNVVFLVTMPHMTTRARLRDMDEAGFGLVEFLRVPQPPAPWPSSGFQLGAALLRKGAGSLFPWLPGDAIRAAA